MTGLRRRGPVSCGGASHLMPTGDGWIAATLARPDRLGAGAGPARPGSVGRRRLAGPARRGGYPAGPRADGAGRAPRPPPGRAGRATAPGRPPPGLGRERPRHPVPPGAVRSAVGLLLRTGGGRPVRPVGRAPGGQAAAGGRGPGRQGRIPHPDRRGPTGRSPLPRPDEQREGNGGHRLRHGPGERAAGPAGLTGGRGDHGVAAPGPRAAGAGP